MAHCLNFSSSLADMALTDDKSTPFVRCMHASTNPASSQTLPHANPNGDPSPVAALLFERVPHIKWWQFRGGSGTRLWFIAASGAQSEER